MNKYLVFLKNPKIWFGIILFIISIISIILIIKALKPTPVPETKLCPREQTKTTCSDGSIKCVPICPYKDMTWNCVSEKCECTDTGAYLCGDQCCTTCNTEKNACCPDEQVYKDSAGVTQCCQAGTKANSDHTACVDSCGTLDCKEDEECINIEGMKDIEATKRSLQTASIQYDNTTDPSIIKFCSKSPDCKFSDETAEPAALHNNYLFHNFSENGLANSDSGLNACFPIDYKTINDSNNNCYTIFTPDACTGACEWINLLDDFGKDKDVFATRIAARNDYHNRSPYGDYCQNKADMYGRYVQFTETDTANSCTVTDCIRQVSNRNTVQVGWNETNRTCSALRIPQENGMKCFTSKNTDCGEKAQEKTTDWSFTDCGPSDKMFYFYKNPNAADCTTEGSNCGNCPFGDNSIHDRNTDGKTHGRIDDFGIACYDDGQIKTPPTVKQKYWSPKVSTNNKGFICQEDPKCTQFGSVDCYPSQGICENANKCNEDAGWTYNPSHTDCNVYKCTKDGKVQNGDPENNDTVNYSFINGSCFRYPVDPSGLDNLPRFTSSDDSPAYYYPTINPVNPLYTCWTTADKATHDKINFTGIDDKSYTWMNLHTPYTISFCSCVDPNTGKFPDSGCVVRQGQPPFHPAG